MILLAIILAVYFMAIFTAIVSTRTKNEKVERSPEWYEAMRELDILDGTIIPDLIPAQGAAIKPEKIESVFCFPYDSSPIMLRLDSGREVFYNEENLRKYNYN